MLSYRAPIAPNYPRLVVEQVALLSVGFLQYSLDAHVNSRDWEFGYDWRTLEARLNGKAYSFDDNHFDTNFLKHPLAGSLYYLTARSNRLGPFASLAIAFGSSALWELFGEFREKISVNDLIVTPFAGMAWAETTTQLGAYFLRDCPATANDVMGGVLAPLIVVHDALDDAERVRDDCNGEPSTHRFRLALTTGETWLQGASPYAQLGMSLKTEVLHLSGLGRRGTGWSVFTDGNVSRLELSTTLAHRGALEATDFRFSTRTVVAGLHYRHNLVRAGVLRRREVLFGWLIGAEYTRHRYDRFSSPDRLFLLDLPAVTILHYGRDSELGWELGLDAGGVFGGADSFAQPVAVSHGISADLTSPAKGEGYNHVAGVMLNPRLRLEAAPVELGIDFRGEGVFAIRVLDASGRVPTTPVSDRRYRLSLWSSIGAPRLPGVTLSLNWLGRAGELGELRVSRYEFSINLGLELAP